MRRAVSVPLTVFALVGGCRTVPFEGPPDLRPGPDLAGADLSDPPDLAPCVSVDAGAGECPCGEAGLCRPATGRLSVQVQTFGGGLKLVVMDDNGCNRHDVASDQPIGVPRWAPDGQRLAYITAKQSSVLHVIGVAPNGGVTCRKSASLGILNSKELAWAGDHEVWLLRPAEIDLGFPLVTWRLGKGEVSQRGGIHWTQFDAISPAGPFAAVFFAGTADLLFFKDLNDPGRTLVHGNRGLGPVRLRRDGRALVYSLDGFHLVSLDDGSDVPLATPTDRSPAFALDGAAIVYTTDDGRLRYHSLNGQFEEQTIPATWRNVYSPDWTPMPSSCEPLLDCN